MTRLSNETYLEFTIQVNVSNDGFFYANCPELELQSSNPDGFHAGYFTKQAAVEDVVKKITDFKTTKIMSIEELASEITNKLTWHSHENCSLSPAVLVNLLKQTSPTILILHPQLKKL